MEIQKRYSIKNILLATLWVGLGGATVFLLVAGVKSKDAHRCKGIEINIHGVSNNFCVDKKDILDDNDLQGIIDYSIVIKEAKVKNGKLSLSKEKYNNEAMYSFLIQCKETYKADNYDKFVLDFIACYNKMEKTIKSLNVLKQIEIVLKSMDVAYTSAINVYKHHNDYRETLKELYDEQKTTNPNYNATVEMLMPSREQVLNRIEEKRNSNKTKAIGNEKQNL